MSKGNGNGRRKFDVRKAVRERVPLLLGFGGKSGSGKTFSALRVATGLQRVQGGEILVVDTEARRSLHYADKFDFQFCQFDAPFSPLDYLAVAEHAVSLGVRHVIIDSMSHEHEGPGGVLEWHAEETERLAKEWGTSPDKAKMSAWGPPKQARRKMIGYILSQPGINWLFCYRAKEKVKPISGGKVENQGLTLIGGEELYFECTARFLFESAGGGVPVLASSDPGARDAIKIPDQFNALIHSYAKKPLDEDLGAKMAEWAAGDAEYTFPKGKHKGKKLREVPADYLADLIDNDGTSDKLRTLFEGELQRRVEEQAPPPTHDPETGEVAADEPEQPELV